jgi:lipoprotein-releasing system permease protein
MNLPFKIAIRYVFSKNKVNAINIISGISIAGLSIGTASLILVMSVFNGLGEIIGNMFNAFNPDLIAIPAEGKSFESSTVSWEKLNQIEGIIAYDEIVEELALFSYGDNQAFGKLKGVGDHYTNVTQIAGHMYNGNFILKEAQYDMAVAGIGMAEKLALNIYDPIKTITVYVPRKKSSGISTTPFRSDILIPAGNFMIQHEFDNEIIFAPISFARELFQMEGESGAIEFRVKREKLKQVKKEVQNILGNEFLVKDRFEQDEAFLKLQNMEKWVSFAILAFTILLISFNLLGVLWMIAREKSQDIAILYSIGMTKKQIRSIFYLSGTIFGVLSISIGFAIALILYFLQKQIGLVRIPDGFAVSSYPVALDSIDFLAAGICVLFICFTASLPASYRASEQNLSLRESPY